MKDGRFWVGKEMEKDVFRLVAGVRQTKKIFWVPMRNRTVDLWIPRSDALPQSHRDSIVSEAFYEICVWHLSLFLYQTQSLSSFLFYKQTWRYRHRWIADPSSINERVSYMTCVLSSSWQDEKHLLLLLNRFLKSVERIMQNSSERLNCSFLWKTTGNHPVVTYLSPNWMDSTNFKRCYCLTDRRVY